MVRNDAAVSVVDVSMELAINLLSKTSTRAEGARMVAEGLRAVANFMDEKFKPGDIVLAAACVDQALARVPASGQLADKVEGWREELGVIKASHAKGGDPAFLVEAASELSRQSNRLDQGAARPSRGVTPKPSTVPAKFDQHDSRLGRILTDVIDNARSSKPDLDHFDAVAEAMQPGKKFSDSTAGWDKLRASLRLGAARLEDAPRNPSLGRKSYSELKPIIEDSIVTAAKAVAVETGISLTVPGRSLT